MVFESEANGKKILKMEGSLTIQMAPELRDVLAGAMEADGHLEVDLMGVEEVDLACLQVIYSAVLTAGGINGALTVKDRASGACAQAVEAVGLSPYMGKHLKIE